MTGAPACIFLDTNVYIVGSALPDSPEARILRWLGYGQRISGPEPCRSRSATVVVSQPLFEQISRVARRLQDKDWAGEILGHLWQDLQLSYVLIDPDEQLALEATGIIPREDVSIYLSARNGLVDCFVSSNHELIKMIAENTGEFECLTPEAFVRRYLFEP